jgi:Ankyrin repeats (many copies)
LTACRTAFAIVGFLTPPRACVRRHEACVQFLLQEGADPFVVDRMQRRSVIHYAASFGYVAVLRKLLSDDVMVPTEEGMVALKSVRVHDVSGNCRSGLPAAALHHHSVWMMFGAVDARRHSMGAAELAQIVPKLLQMRYCPPTLPVREWGRFLSIEEPHRGSKRGAMGT